MATLQLLAFPAERVLFGTNHQVLSRCDVIPDAAGAVLHRHDPQEPCRRIAEYLTFAMLCTLFVGEVTQIMETGSFRRYIWDEGWNILDFCTCISGAIVSACRGVRWDDSQLDNVNTVYVIFMVFTVAFLWGRIFFLFQLSLAMGPLLSTLQKLVKPVFKFFLLYMTVTLSAFFAISFLVGDSDSPAFEGVQNTLVNLFQGGLAGANFNAYDGVDESRRIVGNIVASLYLQRYWSIY